MPFIINAYFISFSGFYLTLQNNTKEMILKMCHLYQVIVFIFVLMIASAALIWIGMGTNPIDSLLVARVWT